MKVARSVAEVLSQPTTLALECIDRLYLNVYVPVLQRAAGAAYFFRTIRGCSVPSSVLMAPITQRFVDAIKRFAEHNRIDVAPHRVLAAPELPRYALQPPTERVQMQHRLHLVGFHHLCPGPPCPRADILA